MTTDNLAPAGQPNPTQEWLKGWDEQLATHPSIQKFKDPQSLGKSYIELEKTLGKNKIVLPAENAKPEEWEAFHRQLGKPSKKDEYKFDSKTNIELPEIERFRDYAYNANVPQQAFQKIMEQYAQDKIDGMKKMNEMKEKQRVESENRLRQEWGTQFEANTNLAKKAFESFADEDVMEFYKEHGNNPALIKVFNKVGNAISNDKLTGGSLTSMNFTPAQAQHEIDTIMSNRQGPYWTARHPEHEATVKRVQYLHTLAQSR